MNVGRSIVPASIPRIAELRQAISVFVIPRIAQPEENQQVTISGMDYKNEIGRRIRKAREDRTWKLEDLSRETGDVLTLKRISAYENGDRMPGPSEVVILGKALGVKPAYLMALDDTDLQLTRTEEALIRNWRTLSERQRMDYFRDLEGKAMLARDPVSDARVEKALPPPPKAPKRTRISK